MEERNRITVDAEKYLKLKHDLEKTKRIIDKALIFLMDELLNSVNTNNHEDKV